MPGRHASPDNSQFYRDLLGFGLRWLLGAIIVFGFAWYLTTQVFGGDTADTTVPPAAPTTVEQSVTQPPPTSSTTPTTRASVSTLGGTSASTSTATTTTVAEATTTSSPPTTLGPELEPSELTVRVLNSTGRNGLAAVVSRDLAALGYNMRLQDNYGTPLATTTIFYVPGLEREAETLAGHLPGATTIAPNPAAEPSAQLLVVLGSSYP